MSYFLSPALVQLRNEINSLWPGRDRASDGWIGDAAHNARKSDHNPDYASGGIVRAIDVDKDGIPADSVVDQIRRDPRTAYVIWNARIWENPAVYPGRGYWRAYTGANAHRQHFHVSVRHGARWDRDGSAWGIMAWLSAPGGGGGGTVPHTPTLSTPQPIQKEEDIMASLDEVDARLTASVSRVVASQLAPILATVSAAARWYRLDGAHLAWLDLGTCRRRGTSGQYGGAPTGVTALPATDPFWALPVVGDAFGELYRRTGQEAAWLLEADADETATTGRAVRRWPGRDPYLAHGAPAIVNLPHDHPFWSLRAVGELPPEGA